MCAVHVRMCLCVCVCAHVHACSVCACVHVYVWCVYMCERPCICMCGSMHCKGTLESMWVNPHGGRSSTSTLQENRQCLMDDDDVRLVSTDNLSTT